MKQTLSGLILSLLMTLAMVATLSLPALSLPAHATAFAQNSNATSNMLAAAFPEAQTMAAPAWLKEGVRATYFIASGIIGGEAAGAGQGYSQYDVVAADKTNVALVHSSFFEGYDGVLGAPMTNAAINAPGIGDFWINPAVLADADRLASDNFVVEQSTGQDAQGTQYQVVRFQYHDRQTLRTSEFDVETGLLILFSQTVLNRDDTRSEAQIRLVSVRQLKLPWKGKTPPTWVKKGLTLPYAGTDTNYLGGTEPLQMPVTFSISVQQANKRFASLTMNSETNGMAQNEQAYVAGVAQWDGFWLPKEALKSKGRSGRIDQDPITGVEVSWQRDGSGNMIINEVGPSWKAAYVYDGKDGVLLMFQRAKNISGSTLVREITLQE